MGGRDDTVEDVDVLVVGAGLSGIGAACHLSREVPHLSYVVIEAREATGGTWDLFRYPGVRSDSDMFTLGYDFRPWGEARSFADGPSILAYVRATATEHGVDEHVRLGQRVTALSWDGAEARWTATVTPADGSSPWRVRARWVHACTGYYRYDRGHTPDLPGLDRFDGDVVHPQHWPEGLPVEDRDVVVVGSGATAVSLVPALARAGARTTMLQRTPSYVMSLPSHDALAERLQRRLPADLAHRVMRWRNVLVSALMYRASRRWPERVGRWMRQQVEGQLPDDVPVDPHFTPPYEPWDQRLCLVPDGDLFAALRDGGAQVVTDTIAGFDAGGVTLGSGDRLPADVLVTATGLELLLLGGMHLEVDGRDVDPSGLVTHRGMMLAGVPNLSFVVGYVAASWTLRADLVSRRVCDLLVWLGTHEPDVLTPVGPGDDEPRRPLLDLDAGYVRRAADRIPSQGSRAPWTVVPDPRRERAAFGDAALLEGLAPGDPREVAAQTDGASTQ